MLRGAALTTSVSLPILSVGAYFGPVALAAALITTSFVKMTYWLLVAQRAVKFVWKEFLHLHGIHADRFPHPSRDG